MPETLVGEVLARATADVLERMFFAGSLGDLPTGQNGDPSIAVRMSFEGERQGVLALRISTAAARTLAADFLGAEAEDGPDEAQVCEVVKELANMICGVALSALERSPLRLPTPQIVPTDDFVLPAAGSYRSFDLGSGGLTIALIFTENRVG